MCLMVFLQSPNLIILQPLLEYPSTNNPHTTKLRLFRDASISDMR